MAIFNSYVKLPEGISRSTSPLQWWFTPHWGLHGGLGCLDLTGFRSQGLLWWGEREGKGQFHFSYWCVLRREWMGCWGLLGWLLLVMTGIIPKNSLLSTSKFCAYASLSLCVKFLDFQVFLLRRQRRRTSPKNCPSSSTRGSPNILPLKLDPRSPRPLRSQSLGGLRCAILFLGRILAFEKKISLFLGFLPQILLFQLVFHLPMGWWWESPPVNLALSTPSVTSGLPCSLLYTCDNLR